MPLPQYTIYNGASPTTAKLAPVATGTNIKTMLQLVTKSGVWAKIKAWGISFDGSAAGTPIPVELIETDVGATITQSAAADIELVTPGSPDPTTAYIDVSSTTKTGYTASAEGTITATRLFPGGTVQVSPMDRHFWQYPLGDEPILDAAKFLRIRVHAPVGVNAICWITFEV